MGFSGPNPISYSDIKDFMELTDTPLSGWEVDTIMKLDRVYMGVANG